MLYEVKVVCRFCSYEFWAAVVSDEPQAPGGLFEVRCPENDSLICFRIAERATPRWDGEWVFQATEWRPMWRLPAEYPIAQVLGQ
jgi:hypothetical protein